MDNGGKWRDGTPSVMPQEVLDEFEAKLDGYQAELEAALLKKPFPKSGEILDLTPPDDEPDE